MLRILIIDDHSLVRSGIQLLLAGLDGPLEFFEAGSCEEGLQRLPTIESLDLILLDLSLPGTSGLAGIPMFRQQRPTIPIIMLSASESETDIRDALNAGARGFVPKSAINDVILSAIRLVLAGGVYIPPSLALADKEETSGLTLPRRPVHLTPRQLAVLELLAQGKPNKVISRTLNMAESTVRVHSTAIFKALEVSNRTEAALVADRLGLIRESEATASPTQKGEEESQ